MESVQKNTVAPAPKHHPIITVLGALLMFVFLVQMVRPGALQWPVQQDQEKTPSSGAPLHHDGEVVQIIAKGNYVHPGSSQSIGGEFILVREKDGAEFVVYPSELNTELSGQTRWLVKTVHNGKLGFSPFYAATEYRYSSYSSYDYYDYYVPSTNAKNTRDGAKPWSEEKPLWQHNETYHAADNVKPRSVEPLTPEPALPSDEEVLRNAEEALKNTPAAPPTPKTNPQ